METKSLEAIGEAADFSATTTAAPRRRGRPRHQPSHSTLDPRDEILNAAAELFSRQGFAGTSTRDIARAVGIRQPSLFHHFRRKEDILRELLERTLQPYEEFLDNLVRRPEPPEQKLFALIRFDLSRLLTGPAGSALPARLPELNQPRFARFREVRNRLAQEYQVLIQRGIDQGELVAGDAELMALSIAAWCESAPTWFTAGSRFDAGTIVDEVSSLAMRSLLRRPDDLARLREGGSNGSFNGPAESDD